ncbi:MAG: hypothetical protein MRQ12_00405, partial [Candidatus Midichloria mitochondrii]|nr:hypothetical protein [Candidatus Midichloria mitochondrii]
LFLRALGLCLQPNIISWKNRLTGILPNVKLRFILIQSKFKRPACWTAQERHVYFMGRRASLA